MPLLKPTSADGTPEIHSFKLKEMKLSPHLAAIVEALPLYPGVRVLEFGLAALVLLQIAIGSILNRV